MGNIKTPKWLDILASITLLIFTALFLGMLKSIVNAIPGDTLQQQDLIAQYETAILIIPFFTAALASNLLSHVILTSRDYSNTISLGQALKIVWNCIRYILAVSILIPFYFLYYVTCVKYKK